ncbi:MAG TPA: hypothetical protein VJB89_02745 [Candidatus Nanoarchaeia archaeon]|nr:hypothetical protein [Candidatus Nanoarchaeia archaeon]
MQITHETYLSQLNRALDQISNGDFSKAIASYNHLKAIFDKLPKNKKTEELKQKTLIYYNELKLYLHLNEAELFAQKGDPIQLHKSLDLVEYIENYELAKKLPSIESIKKYIKTKKSIDLVDCQQVLNLKSFDEKLKKTKDLITYGHLEKAREEFSNLLLLINRIPDLDKKIFLKLHIELEKLYKRIAYPILIQNAYSKKINIQSTNILKLNKEELITKSTYLNSQGINQYHPLYDLHKKITNPHQIDIKPIENLSNKAKQIISEISSQEEVTKTKEIKIKTPSFKINKPVPETKIENISPYCEFESDFQSVINSLKHNDPEKARKILNSV